MLRRRAVRLSALALAAAAATGCATFSDNDAVARVGDVEMTSDELADTLASSTSAADPTQTAVDAHGLPRSTLTDIQAWWCLEGPWIVRPAV